MKKLITFICSIISFACIVLLCVSFSIQEILQTAINNTRVTMSKQELEEFKKRYLSKIKISIENEIIQVDI